MIHGEEKMTSVKQTMRRIQVKEIIGSLCHILNSNVCITRITPERFRQAKFDQPEAITPMWTLMKELLELQIQSSHDTTTVNQSISPNKDNIRSLFYQCGYRCAGFYDDGEVGSRELLLAVGWLLSKLDFVNREVKMQLNNTTPPISTFHLNAFHALDSVVSSSAQDRVSVEASKHIKSQRGLGSGPSTRVGRAKYLVWLMGRLRFTLKALHCEQQALCAAMHHIHTATQRVGAPPHTTTHLTAWEAFLLRHPKHMKEYVEHLEKQASLLQACLTWKEHESVFWQWMVSVHEAKLSSGPNDADEPYPSIAACSDALPAALLTGEVPSMMRQLCDLESTLARQLQDLEADTASRGVDECLGQISDCPDVAKRKADIENSIRAKLFISDEQFKSSTNNFPLHTLQFAFKPEEMKNKKKSEALPKNSVNVKYKILRLTEGVRQLQEELDDLKAKQQQRLDSFAECLTGVVCIPPMSEKASYLPLGS